MVHTSFFSSYGPERQKRTHTHHEYLINWVCFLHSGLNGNHRKNPNHNTCAHTEHFGFIFISFLLFFAIVEIFNPNQMNASCWVEFHFIYCCHFVDGGVFLFHSLLSTYRKGNRIFTYYLQQCHLQSIIIIVIIVMKWRIFFVHICTDAAPQCLHKCLSIWFTFYFSFNAWKWKNERRNVDISETTHQFMHFPSRETSAIVRHNKHFCFLFCFDKNFPIF